MKKDIYVKKVVQQYNIKPLKLAVSTHNMYSRRVAEY